jgi:hypothetical protein
MPTAVSSFQAPTAWRRWVRGSSRRAQVCSPSVVETAENGALIRQPTSVSRSWRPPVWQHCAVTSLEGSSHMPWGALHAQSQRRPSPRVVVLPVVTNWQRSARHSATAIIDSWVCTIARHDDTSDQFDDQRPSRRHIRTGRPSKSCRKRPAIQCVTIPACICAGPLFVV